MVEKILVTLKVEIPGREVPVRHDIKVVLELVDGHLVQGTLENSPGSLYRGEGKTTLGAVISWLSSLDHNVGYIPAYRKSGDKE